MNKLESIDTKKLVLLAFLTAIVVVLQLVAIATRPFLPMFSITLVLVPIIIGAAIIGVFAGAWLGFVFGLVVLISGDASPFLVVNPAGAILVVLVKGILAGYIAGLVYKLLADRSKTIAAISAAIVCPIVNTGIFVIGCYVFFLPTITSWGESVGAANVTAYIFLGMIGINILIELGVNLVLCPTIIRLIQIRKDKASA